MRKTIYFLAYLAAFIIGVLLLIFNYQSVDDDSTILKYTIIAIGIIFVVPAVFVLLSLLKPKRDEKGEIVRKAWYVPVITVITLIWGILILCMPKGFLGNLDITLGVTLIIAGLVQVSWLARMRRDAGASMWRQIVPVLMVGGGVAVLILVGAMADPIQRHSLGCIVSGILLIIYAVNGIASLKNRLPVMKESEKSVDKAINSHEGETTAEGKSADVKKTAEEKTSEEKKTEHETSELKNN